MMPLLFIALVFLWTGCKEPVESPATTAAAPAGEKWQRWDDAAVGFEHPPGWIVRDSKHPEGLTGTRLISIPNAGLGTRGLINMIDEDLIPEEEKRPLEQIVKEHLDPLKATLYRPYGPTTKLGVNNGDCRVFAVEEWVSGCAPVDSMTGKRVPCVAPAMHAYCLSSGGRYFQIHCSLSRYHENGKPNDEARANARIFERFLRSLEFKKG